MLEVKFRELASENGQNRMHIYIICEAGYETKTMVQSKYCWQVMSRQ